MERSYKNYVLINYLVPFSLFVVIFILLLGMKNNAQSFIVDHVIGIHRISKKSKKNPENSNENPENSNKNPKKSNDEGVSEELDMYLYLEEENAVKFTCKLRWLSYFLTVSILTLLLTIIFENCVLSNEGILVGDWCPDYEADCFDVTAISNPIGPFQCFPNAQTNFSVNSASVWCVGWVIKDQNARDVLDTIGICGGLLGIVACIVPLIYHLSAYQTKPEKAYFWVLMPLLPLIALILIGVLLKPLKPSMLTIVSLTVLFVLGSGSWVWAYFAMHKKAYGVYPWNWFWAICSMFKQIIGKCSRRCCADAVSPDHAPSDQPTSPAELSTISV